MSPFWVDFFNSYENLKTPINFIKDLSLLTGAFALIKYIKYYSYNKHKEELDFCIKKQLEIINKLQEYVNTEFQNNIRDICIRFVYYKDFPQGKEDDGFKHPLHYVLHTEKSMPSEMIDQTGIRFATFIGFDRSIYINKHGIFFIDEKNKEIKGFKEIKGNYHIIRKILFKNIINFDFLNRILYEPVFYVKYKYNSRKLYEDAILIHYKNENPHHYNNTIGLYDNHFHQKIYLKKFIKSPQSIKYFFLETKYIIINIFKITIKTFIKHRQHL